MVPPSLIWVYHGEWVISRRYLFTDHTQIGEAGLASTLNGVVDHGSARSKANTSLCRLRPQHELLVDEIGNTR